MSDSPILRRVEAVLAAVDNEERALSSWELDFLDSLRNQLCAGKAATDLQIAKLQQIEEDE